MMDNRFVPQELDDQPLVCFQLATPWPAIAWSGIIRAITPDHAVLINRQDRKGSMILAE